MDEKHRRNKRRSNKRNNDKIERSAKVYYEKLKSPTQTRKEVKALLLKAIDEAAETLKQLPRITSSPSSSVSISPTNSKSPRKKGTSSTKKKSSKHQQQSPSSCSFTKSKCSICPLNVKAKKALSKPYYSRDQFATHSGHHIVTREYFTADGYPILSPSSKSLADPECVNTVVIQNSGPNVSGMIMDFKVKVKNPDGTSRELQLGIEIPSFD